MLVAFLTANVAWGQATKPVKIVFPAEGEREVWVGPTATPEVIKSPASASGVSITVDVPASGAGQSLFVHDKKTGNVAARAVDAALKTGEWKVAPSDDKYVYSMKFLVQSDGKAVSSALVNAKTGSESRTALIGPSDQGMGSVYCLTPGQVEVSVQYKVGNENHSTPPQTFAIKLGAGEPATKTITIAEKVETVVPPTATSSDTGKTSKAEEGAKGSPETSAPKEKPEPAPNPIATIINMAVGVAVIGALGYVIYRYVQNNQAQVEQGLKKLGIGAPEPPPDGNLPPVPAQPQPLKPINLGDTTPSAAVTPVAAPTFSATAVANPRLVKSDGSVVLLMEGASTVGRESGLEVSLPGESSVSRNHARLDRAGDSVTLTDTGSTNGTFVNGAKISGSVVLNPGDAIQFGAIAFRYEV